MLSANPDNELFLTSSRVTVTFIDKEGQEHEFYVNVGDNLLDIAQAFDLEMEGKPYTKELYLSCVY